MVHHIYLMLAGGDLFRAPIVKSRPPRRVLDLGTGTGIWAIEMAEEFPNSIIVGTDLSPIQPGWVPSNCKFYVDDFESDWEYHPDEYFDYIHGRALCGSVADWPRFFDQAYHSLNSGGWLEMQEYQTWLFSDDNTMEDAVWIKEWSEGTDEASTRFGKRLRTAQDIKKWMEQAGFLDVHEEIYKVRVSALHEPLTRPLRAPKGADRYVAEGQEVETAWQILPRDSFGFFGAICSGSVYTRSSLQSGRVADIDCRSAAGTL
jgi:trans-aconitate methyltransferase